MVNALKYFVFFSVPLALALFFLVTVQTEIFWPGDGATMTRGFGFPMIWHARAPYPGQWIIDDFALLMNFGVYLGITAILTIGLAKALGENLWGLNWLLIPIAIATIVLHLYIFTLDPSDLDLQKNTRFGTKTLHFGLQH